MKLYCTIYVNNPNFKAYSQDWSTFTPTKRRDKSLSQKVFVMNSNREWRKTMIESLWRIHFSLSYLPTDRCAKTWFKTRNSWYDSFLNIPWHCFCCCCQTELFSLVVLLYKLQLCCEMIFHGFSAIQNNYK